MGLFDFFKKNKQAKKTSPSIEKEDLSTAEGRNKYLKTNVKLVVKQLEKGFTEDDLYYMNYLLELKFFDKAVVHLFKLIEERGIHPSNETTELLDKLKPFQEEILNEENKPIVALSNDEVISIAVKFMKEYQVLGELMVHNIAFNESYQAWENFPCWVLQAKLNPPCSLNNRIVDIVISAKTQQVETMQ